MTGSNAWKAFAKVKPDDATITTRLLRKIRSASSSSAPAVDVYVKEALDRAYMVAYTLRGSVGVKRRLRRGAHPDLGYIAVSGEDDPPHRPVNVPTIDQFPQFDIEFTHQGIDLRIRYMIASNSLVGQSDALDLRVVPPDFKPVFPAQDQIILFIHGHSSRLEECSEILPHLLRFGSRKGRSYTVVAIDLPNCGYSSMFADTKVAKTADSKYPGGFPVLRFLTEFIDSFVTALTDQVLFSVVKSRIAAIIGGSLGGNLGLRLASGSPGPKTPQEVQARDWIRNVSHGRRRRYGAPSRTMPSRT